MTSRLRRASLLYHTVRYLRPSQVLWRARRMSLSRWRALTRAEAPLAPDPTLALRLGPCVYQGLDDLAGDGPWRKARGEALARAQAIAQNRFQFLAHERSYGDHPDWQDEKVSQLWRFHLHYFDYVTDLLIWAASGAREAAYAAFRRLVRSWIAHNRVLVGDAWHPYTVSLRLVNWLNGACFFSRELSVDAPLLRELRASAAFQARYLAGDLELDVRGNHLLENVRALLWAGLSFQGPAADRWLTRALTLLSRELPEQVLPDGAHFERVPSYHVLVLSRLLEMVQYLRLQDAPVPEVLVAAGTRMHAFLRDLLPACGEIPLLKDSALDASWPAADVLRAADAVFGAGAASRNARVSLYSVLLLGLEAMSRRSITSTQMADPPPIRLDRDAGYCILRGSRGEHMVVDVGPCCPDYLPAHAHADALSYVLSVDSQPVVVDSGVYEYAEGRYRSYFRSTRAHNTVSLGSADQSEVWASFRVGRRAHTRILSFVSSDAHTLLQAEHDGYARRSSRVRHRRTILALPADGAWLIWDDLWGKGIESSDSYVHLAPRLGALELARGVYRVTDPDGCCLVDVTVGGADGTSVVHGAKTPDLQGWYSPRFGVLHPNDVLCLRRQGPLPHRYGYLISTRTAAGARASIACSGDVVVVTLPNGVVIETSIPRTGLPQVTFTSPQRDRIYA